MWFYPKSLTSIIKTLPKAMRSMSILTQLTHIDTS
jgi:hypothetical protein